MDTPARRLADAQTKKNEPSHDLRTFHEVCEILKRNVRIVSTDRKQFDHLKKLSVEDVWYHVQTMTSQEYFGYAYVAINGANN